MDTIEVTGDYTVRTNVKLHFTDQTGFYIQQVDDNPPSLTNKGSVEVTSDQADTSIAGIQNGDSYFYGGLIWNREGATFTVSATGEDSSAYGYTTGSWGENVLNDGTFTVTATGLATGVNTWSGSDTSFTNNGDFRVVGGEGAVGVSAYNGDIFVNTGTVFVDGGQGGGVGFTASYPDSTFNNSGSIVVVDQNSEVVSYGLDFGNYNTIDFINSGLISSEVAIRAEGGADDMVHNSGTIVGDIDLGYGADLVSNGGSITGAIYLGQGDDVVETTANGSYHGAIYGGDGNDSLTGGSKHDVIYGDNGQDGGQDGDDDLSGGRGRDSLFGNDGNDNLTGGHGADVLTGGRGRDVFTYTSVQDSSAHHADLITDLRVADTVDLSAVDANAGVAGDQAFTLVDAFDGHAGQLTVSYDAQSGQSLIQADTDGDGAADLVIRANGDQTDFTGFVL